MYIVYTRPILQYYTYIIVCSKIIIKTQSSSQSLYNRFYYDHFTSTFSFIEPRRAIFPTTYVSLTTKQFYEICFIFQN